MIIFQTFTRKILRSVYCNPCNYSKIYRISLSSQNYVKNQYNLQNTLTGKYNHVNHWRNFSRLPKTPDLIYVPRLSRWLMNKIRLKMLKKLWDPDFSEGGFIYGSTKAVCRITEIIHDNNPQALKGLVTLSVYLKLTDDITNRLTKKQKSIIKLTPQDIKMLIPVTVSFKKDGSTKTCRIGMRVLALKWYHHVNSGLQLILVALQTEFIRDYASIIDPEWTISAFDILECTTLAESTKHV